LFETAVDTRRFLCVGYRNPLSCIPPMSWDDFIAVRCASGACFSVLSSLQHVLYYINC